MVYNTYQKRVLRDKGLCRIKYKRMWKTAKHELGYSTKGTDKYEIVIANDIENNDTTAIVLLHEIGHVHYGHLDEVDYKEEFKAIKSICEKYGKSFEQCVGMYGGPMQFLNVVMDLEINTKLLTIANVKHMKNENIGILVPETFGIEVEDTFRDYYEPIIKSIPNSKEEYEEMKKKIKQNLKNSAQSEDSEDSEGEDSEGNESNNSESNGSNSSKGSKSNSSKGSKGDSSEDGEDDSSEGNESEDYEDGESDSLDGSGDDNDYGISLPDWMKDLAEGCESTGDEEIDKALEKEGYKSGNEKDKGITETGESESVNEAVEKIEEEEEKKSIERERAKSYGLGHFIGNKYEESEVNDEGTIKNFLSKIMVHKPVYMQDSLRHHNHGTRENKDGILYSSKKLKVNITKQKLAVLVDISGSMDATSVLKALKALRGSMSSLSYDSKLITWDVSLCDEFPITKVPNTVYEGGGTDMAKGLEYCIEKGFTDIVIYSDMRTPIIPMIELIDKHKVNVHTIIVDTDKESFEYPEAKRYVKLNKSYIFVK